MKINAVQAGRSVADRIMDLEQIKTPQVNLNEFLDLAQSSLLSLHVNPMSHKFLAEAPTPLGSRIAQHLKSSFDYARGVVDYYNSDRDEQVKHGGMQLCKGASWSALDYLLKCVARLEENNFDPAELATLRLYHKAASEYLDSLGGGNKFFNNSNQAIEINGVQSEKLMQMSSFVLEFVKKGR